MKMHFERGDPGTLMQNKQIYNLYKYIIYVQKQLSVLNRDEE